MLRRFRRGFIFTYLIRKIFGLILGVAGIALIVETLPTYLWLVILGLFFIWCGWLIYGVDRKRWI